jgi:hypothetical protein
MDDEHAQNRRMLAYGAALVLVIAAGVGVWAYLHRKPAPQPVITAATEPAPQVPAADAAPVVEHPVAAEAAAAPLPALPESDAPVAAELQRVFGAPAVAAWLVPDQVLRRFVATVDNLPRNVPLEKRRPLNAPSEAFTVDRTTTDSSDGTERITLSARNSARYDAAIAVLEKTDAQSLATLYRHFYPLLQQAYEDLGYPDRYFNDRMVIVIDDLLRTPDISQPALVQPKVLYQFEDPKLEQLSSGQKLLLRMGPAHAAKIKARLRELRALITAPAKK